MSRKLIVGIGELLWDLLHEGRQLGGAPANFTVMSARLGNHGVVASRIGADELGNAARLLLQTTPVDSTFLQTDAAYPTGSVSVTIEDGQPEYVIHEPAAWDFLELTPEWRTLAGSTDAVCFGTLAQRSERARETIRSFVASTGESCVRVFDVNLRTPFFSASVLQDSLRLATLVKLNDAEMPQVLTLTGLSNETRTDEAALLAGARLLLAAFPLRMVCVTMGAHGSLLVTPREHHRHHGIAAKVADTVGAGDAFTAALVCYYLQGAPLAVLNEAGNRWGSWVASQPGAMPPLPEETYQTITRAIQSS